MLVSRTMAIPALRRLYFETLIATAPTMTEAPDASGRGWLEREVDRLSALVSAAAAADPVAPFTFAEFDGNVRGLRGARRLDRSAPRSCPRPVYVEVPPPGRLPR